MSGLNICERDVPDVGEFLDELARASAEVALPNNIETSSLPGFVINQERSDLPFKEAI